MFVVVNLVIIGLIVKFLISKKDEVDYSIKTPLYFVMAGGIGNLIDRVCRGFVIDYLDFTPFIKFPVFNFADICVVGGCIALIIAVIISNRKNK